MQGLFRAVLLALLVLGSNADLGCGVPADVKMEDLHKLEGIRWVLTEAYTNYTEGVQVLLSANSSVVEIKVNADGKSFHLAERNVLMGMCLTYYINMTVSDPESIHSYHMSGPGIKDFNGTVSPFNDHGKANIFLTCPHCLVIIYRAFLDGVSGTMLLIYRQEGKHLDAEELTAARAEHDKMAECLNFMVPSHFKYDGTAEFCQERREGTAGA